MMDSGLPYSGIRYEGTLGPWHGQPAMVSVDPKAVDYFAAWGERPVFSPEARWRRIRREVHGEFLEAKRKGRRSR